jgi:hypothetical protein
VNDTRARFEGPVLTAFAEQLAFAPDMRDGASDGLSVTEDPVPLAPYPASLARGREQDLELATPARAPAILPSPTLAALTERVVTF